MQCYSQVQYICTPTITSVLVTTQLITMPTGAMIRSSNVITCLCTSTIISQALINIYIRKKVAVRYSYIAR